AMTGDYAALERVCAPDVDFNDGSADLKGIDQVKEFVRTFSTAFPDAKIEFHDFMEAGNKAAAELTYSGTHTGPLSSPQGDIPATGKRVSLPGSAFVTIQGDRVTRFRGYYDQMAMMAQLGLMPEAAPHVAAS
ncbi:MAG: hypothetical protein EPO16_12040, partial [Dehalococcoidia bacterium]